MDVLNPQELELHAFVVNGAVCVCVCVCVFVASVKDFEGIHTLTGMLC